MSAAMVVEGWVSQFSKLRERVKPRRRPAGESEAADQSEEEASRPDSPAASTPSKKMMAKSAAAASALWDSTLSEDTVFMLMDRFAPN